MEQTPVYLLCFHSQKASSLDGTKGQFRVVESTIQNGDWPYDNGDDPSFYVAHDGGTLTWGICRPDVRNSIPIGGVAVFFSFTLSEDEIVLYRLCAVTTVVDKVDVRAVENDKRLAPFRTKYINALIRGEKGGWRYDEMDRPSEMRHENWLWRIADHRGINKDDFTKRYWQIYDSGWIPDSVLDREALKLAKNYIIFSKTPPDGYISPDPPEVAVARKGEREEWTNTTLQALTVETAAKFIKRNYLRVANKSGRNVHRHICFDMPTRDVGPWRKRLIDAIRR